MNTVEKLYAEVQQMHNIIREVNFYKDIDIEKSDRFILKGDSYIEFLCAETNRIIEKDYFEVVGKKIERGNCISFVSEASPHIDLKYKAINMLLLRELNVTLSDGLLIEPNDKRKMDYSICIFNKKFNDILFKMANKDLPFRNEEFNNNETKRIKFDIISDGLVVINYYYKNQIEADYSTMIKYEKHIDYLMIDINTRKLIVNGERFNFRMPKGFLEKEMYVNVQKVSNISNEEPDLLKFRHMSYYHKKGYIYFKPIKTFKSKCKIFILYKGNPEFEVYSNSNNKWELVVSNIVIEEENIIIRAKMNTGDKIHRMLFASIEQL